MKNWFSKSSEEPKKAEAEGKKTKETEPQKKVSCITDSEGDFVDLANGNRLVGEKPQMKNSKIIFKGQNNILYCEENVKLSSTSLVFQGSNSVVYLGGNRNNYILNVSIYNDCVFHMGKDNYMNGLLNAMLSEQRHIFIGSEGLFAFNLWLRNADPHLVYDADSRERINPTRSIFLGDHVWVGQSAMILKGSQIGSGSIIGAMSVVAGKKVPPNTSWGGNPARMLRENIFWDGSCVHSWTEEKTKESQSYQSDRYIYSREKDGLDFDEIDAKLTEAKTAQDKLAYLLELKAPRLREENGAEDK